MPVKKKEGSPSTSAERKRKQRERDAAYPGRKYRKLDYNVHVWMCRNIRYSRFAMTSLVLWC